MARCRIRPRLARSGVGRKYRAAEALQWRTGDNQTSASMSLGRRIEARHVKSGSFEKLPRRLFMVSLALVVLGGTFSYGAFAHRDNLPPIPQLRAAYETLTTIGDNDVTQHPRRHHLQPSREQGNGVTVNQSPDDGALVLMAGFFDEENQIRIIERDGTLVKKWSLDYFEHFPDPETRACDPPTSLRVDTHGVHAAPRGEVVFNYEYCGSVKLDQCGGLLWSINGQTHHSLVPAEAGGYWVLGRNEWVADEQPGRLPSVFTQATDQIILEDTVLRVTEEGEILDEISIPDLLRENGLEALLTVNGDAYWSDTIEGGELVHANKVTELPSEIAASYPLFAAGDLAISLRGRNLVMVVDPVTWDVKWHQTGPWLRQHDPEFRPDGRISIFNNNVYGPAYVNGQTALGTPYTTNIIAMDPVSREPEVIFGERPGQEMLSVVRGQHELLEDDGMLITEFDAGRVLEVDRDGQIVWEYVNHYNDDFVGEISDSFIYPAGYFHTGWQTCEQ